MGCDKCGLGEASGYEELGLRLHLCKECFNNLNSLLRIHETWKRFSTVKNKMLAAIQGGNLTATRELTEKTINLGNEVRTIVTEWLEEE